MDKHIITIPKGYRYISDWDGYRLEDYAFPHILNKSLTGCGFTEYGINAPFPVVLISPRKFLLENKENQHEGDVYYAENKLSNNSSFEQDVSKPGKPKEEKTKIDQFQVEQSLLEYKDGIREYILECKKWNRIPKILVTYDSFRHVKEVLYDMGILDNFQIIVDEFQSIFIDARFKSDTELELLYHLRGIQRICFVSATPMLDEYLRRLDEFKDLPYYEFDWETLDPGRVKNPVLNTKKTTRGLNEELNKVIQSYLRGEFEVSRTIDEFGIPHEIISNEGVFFVNSVNMIARAITKNELTPDQCNILCAKVDENRKAIRAAFNKVLPKSLPRGFDPLGRIPKRGEPHKMFTFCTRTVYLGADFYSTCARTFIFCDANIDCLSVDISMDLEQILGRQRLDENPWKDSADLFIKTTREVTTKAEFDKILDKKTETSKRLLKIYNDLDLADLDARKDLAKKYEKDAKNSKYKDDYVAVNKHGGSNLYPVFNNLMLVSEQRAFDIQQVDYKNRFTVFSALKQRGFIVKDRSIEVLVDYFNAEKTFSGKLQYIHEVNLRYDLGVFNIFLNSIPRKFRDYYTVFGYDKLKALQFNEPSIIREWNKLMGNSSKSADLKTIIHDTFMIGSRYSLPDIKSTISMIYSNIGYQKTPKATDLEEYFEVKKVRYVDKATKERVHGFEIISKK